MSVVIVALDVDSGDKARSIVNALGDAAPFYKIGLQLLTADGPGLVRELVAAGKQVFLDLKLYEIPNSVAGAVVAAGELGVTMVTVHASGGSGILRAAVQAARAYPQLRVLALTVVTSLQQQDLQDTGVAGSVDEQVVRLARLADAAGCHGVVASPREAALLRSVLRPGMLIVTPGIQLEGGPMAGGPMARDRMANAPRAMGPAADSNNNPTRAATPGAAVRAGATHIVVGRSVVQAADPRAALAAICQDVAYAMA